MRTELLMQTGFYQLRSLPLSRKRCINLYPQPIEDKVKGFTVISLQGTPGIPIFKDTGLSGRSRGCIVAAGVPYYVVGTNFISLASDGTVTNHGTIAGTSDVSMAYNSKTICIVVPDGNGYFFTVATTTLAQIVDATYTANQVTTVNYKKGYFVFTSDGEFFSSSKYDVNNGQDFDALDFDVDDISADAVVATFTNHDDLYVFNTGTATIWDNIETTLFPFSEIDGANFEIGCLARLSPVKFNDDFLFIGGGKNENPGVWRVSGTGIARISTDAVEYILSLATTAELSAAISDTYSQDGHVFAVFTVGDYTMVYDDTASIVLGSPVWSERQSGFTNGESHKRWRGQHICKAHGKLLVGDNESGKIGYLDLDTYYEFGERIERVVISQPVDVKGSPVFQDEIEMFIEAGVGNSDSPDPAWLFSYSDNGRTWSEARARLMGKVGEYAKRLVWSRLGRFSVKRVLRYKTDDPVKITIYKWMTDVG